MYLSPNMRIKFYFSLIVAFLVISANYYAGIFNVFWTFPWFDIPMHIFGGFMVGLFAQSGIDYLNDVRVNRYRFILVVLSAFVVGAMWEVVEFYMGLTGGLSGLSRLDTIKDMVDDLFGSIISIGIWKFLFNNIKSNDKK